MRTALFIIALAVASLASENIATVITKMIEAVKTTPALFFIFGIFITMDLADFVLGTKK